MNKKFFILTMAPYISDRHGIYGIAYENHPMRPQVWIKSNNQTAAVHIVFSNYIDAYLTSINDHRCSLHGPLIRRLDNDPIIIQNNPIRDSAQDASQRPLTISDLEDYPATINGVEFSPFGFVGADASASEYSEDSEYSESDVEYFEDINERNERDSDEMSESFSESDSEDSGSEELPELIPI